ncbi:hypothetical protein Btus_2773 [Kyrpidia tusciae DSM 2912]|uniref:Uncharacterized protein n=1 Tax=Kyrpidia tusciae (strain DSM 2912 / NBRC 15312 / T2) TaxID=562970 RepID=D5WUU8_KYRT2|nr:hypothetical protein Btus_2773 [Kyrpidia tusciae DSM 2912]
MGSWDEPGISPQFQQHLADVPIELGDSWRGPRVSVRLYFSFNYKIRYTLSSPGLGRVPSAEAWRRARGLRPSLCCHRDPPTPRRPGPDRLARRPGDVIVLYDGAAVMLSIGLYLRLRLLT